ncbi:MAG: hypothetical protein ISP84_02220 [Candidatus Poseidonia sp.]|jgi:hypothetical protein|nr:hypothetical protein [Poseidonia sp.]
MKVLDPQASVLMAQVRKAEASHKMDTSNQLLRSRHFQGPSSVVYLGDVAQALLAQLAHPETPVFTQPPGYNEQRWRLETRSGDLSVAVESLPYWAFGLVTSGYLNIIRLEGPLDQRARLVLDITSSLGQPPWELAHPKRAERIAMKHGLVSLKHNETVWKDLRGFARESLDERLQQHAQRTDTLLAQVGNEGDHRLIFEGLRQDLDMAKQALAEDNAPGVERAMARMEASHIQLQPEHPMEHERGPHVDTEGLLENETEVTFVDLTGEFAEEE